MDSLAYSWAAQQLTEYLTALGTLRRRRRRAAAPASSARPRPSRPRRASSCATARCVASIGFPAPSSRPTRRGSSGSVAAPLDDAGTGWLALSRDGEPFNVEETALLRGMARALAQTVRTLELVGSLRSRQALLERLAQIQRSIVHRTDLESLLDAIVDGARELIGDEVVSLRLTRSERRTPARRLGRAAGGGA